MKRKAVKYPPAKGRSKAMLEETAIADPPLATVINVRAAKDQLSSLLEQAAQGGEVIITSDGQPKAKLVPVMASRKRFRVHWELLRSMPLNRTAPTAEEILRHERDGRA
jgi:prevent-host-death family protein